MASVCLFWILPLCSIGFLWLPQWFTEKSSSAQRQNLGGFLWAWVRQRVLDVTECSSSTRHPWRTQSFTSTLSGHCWVQGKNMERLHVDVKVTFTYHHWYISSQGGCYCDIYLRMRKLRPTGAKLCMWWETQGDTWVLRCPTPWPLSL